jgi:integrase
VKLTDISIRTLKSPPKGAIIYTDDSLPGFGVRVSEGGTKSYVLTHGPRRARETIARVGILGLKDARTEAKRRLADYTLGKTLPRVKRWNTALDEYLAEIKAKRRPSTHKSYQRHLKSHFPFGDTRMTDITPHDLQKDLDRLSDRPSELHHAYINLRAFIRWAHRKHYIDGNPMERMQTPEGSKSKTRVLSDKEIKKVWAACPDDPFGRIVRLLIFCGQRVGETSKITPEMIEKDTIRLPAELCKNGKEHVFPFPKMAKPYLHDLTYNGFSKAKARLDKESGVSNYTLHDLRRTYASKMASLGVPLHVIERLLNHISGTFSGIVGVYQHYDFLPEMRDAVKRWDTYLQTILKT